MAEADQALIALVTTGREERDVEYKGSSGRESFAWDSDPVKARIARTAMAMANIGGGWIVIGMDQSRSDAWEPNGVSDEVDATYKQDEVQEYVNLRADPYVKLALRHEEIEGRRFVILQIEGFDELPVVCTTSASRILRQGAVYTRSYTRHSTVEIQSQTEMRELLNRAIEIGIEKRLRPFIEVLGRAGIPRNFSITHRDRFEEQRGDP